MVPTRTLAHLCFLKISSALAFAAALAVVGAACSGTPETGGIPRVLLCARGSLSGAFAFAFASARATAAAARRDNTASCGDLGAGVGWAGWSVWRKGQLSPFVHLPLAWNLHGSGELGGNPGPVFRPEPAAAAAAASAPSSRAEGCLRLQSPLHHFPECARRATGEKSKDVARSV